jgi:hypothetical protein
MLGVLLSVGDLGAPMNWAAFTLAMLQLVISVATVALMWLLRVPARVKLPGPHAVGTTSWNMVVDDGNDLGSRLVPVQMQAHLG